MCACVVHRNIGGIYVARSPRRWGEVGMSWHIIYTHFVHKPPVMAAEMSISVFFLQTMDAATTTRTLTGQRRRMMVMAGRFAQHEIVLADEFVVVQHVQLFAGAQLLAADAARETVEMEHFVARLSHQIRRCDAVAAAAAFGAIASVCITKYAFISINPPSTHLVAASAPSTHRKKSLRQYSFASRLKHLSVSG